MLLDKIFKNEKNEYVNIIDLLFGKDNAQNYIYTLAEAHAIDLIARMISKCEIQTFEKEKKSNKVKEMKGNLYWTLNLKPNFNDNGTAFIYKLITKLLTKGSALIVINKTSKDNFLYVADSYNCDNNILYNKTFDNIIISDNEGHSITLNKKYTSENTIYYSLKNEKLSIASENFKSNTIKILNAAQKSFIKSNMPKWRLKTPGGQPTMVDFKTGKFISYEEYKAKLLEGINSDEEAIIMLSEMFDLININDKNSKNISDYSSVIKQIGDAVALKWGIPIDVFYGTQTDKSNSINDFITTTIDTYFEFLEDGFNISLVGKESYLNGEYIKFNRLNINHKDLIDKASGWDKLISNGFSFNQLSNFLGLPEINEEWANEHYITKNYANVKGGDNDEK